MNLAIDVQYACSAPAQPPAEKDIRRWVGAVLAGRREAAQLTVRIVDPEESRQLNETYRHQSGPTNVLSFTFEEPELLDPPLLGDVVICAALVADEARAQGKAEEAHWAHLVVHGVLHLLGYDHEHHVEARRMEDEERKVLTQLGFEDPYASEESVPDLRREA